MDLSTKFKVWGNATFITSQLFMTRNAGNDELPSTKVHTLFIGVFNIDLSPNKQHQVILISSSLRFYNIVKTRCNILLTLGLPTSDPSRTTVNFRYM